MGELVEMSLKKAVANFPKFANAVACIKPYMKHFDSRGVAVETTGRFLEVSSQLPSPDFPVHIKRWGAMIYADSVRLSPYENRGWAWVSNKSEKLSLEEFTAFLQRVSDQQRRAVKAPKGRKPEGGRPSPPSPKARKKRATKMASSRRSAPRKTPRAGGGPDARRP